jgi:hypothetical protein
MHISEVVAVHEVQRHAFPGEPAVAVATMLPKLSPVTVSRSFPPALVTAAFILKVVITGES